MRFRVEGFRLLLGDRITYPDLFRLFFMHPVARTAESNNPGWVWCLQLRLEQQSLSFIKLKALNLKAQALNP